MIRLFDILFSSIALLALSPLLLIICLILRLTGEGEVFFFQQRVGKNRKPFNLIKFVTMLKDSANIGTGTVTIYNDPRVLPFGKFLRSSKINELPQLINIFIGDMSLIGPRPQTQRCFDAFTNEVQKSISSIRPGLSGVGSIIFSNEESMLKDLDSIDIYDEIIAPYKGDLEIWFTNNNNIFVYFVLIIATIFAIIGGSPKLLHTFFKDLPVPSHEAKELLNQ